MKTFRVDSLGEFVEDLCIRVNASHDCDGCVYHYAWIEHGESFDKCEYEPDEKEYVSNQSACIRDIVFNLNDEEEIEIRRLLKDDPELLYDYLDSLSDVSDAMKTNDNVFDFIVDHYERGEES
jgi:hypothetical protein